MRGKGDYNGEKGGNIQKVYWHAETLCVTDNICLLERFMPGLPLSRQRNRGSGERGKEMRGIWEGVDEGKGL